MPIRTAIWKVGVKPEPLKEATIANEGLLEEMIVKAPQILSDEWMLIGRQEITGLGGRIDLLAIAPDGSLVLIELKRDMTPREVVAQALDYASWVEKLKPEDIAAIYGRFAPDRNLAEDFRKRFGQELDEESLNESHQIVIAAASLDDSTERIVAYLSDWEIPINVLCFQVFAHGNEHLLSRAWLLDPIHAVIQPIGPKEPWNGEFYVSYGQGAERSWKEAIQYEFISAGGGVWYTRTLELLKPGDRIWVKIPGAGFVGVGRVTGPRQPASEFKLKTSQGEKPVMEVVKDGHYHRHLIHDKNNCEYFVPVRWIQTFPVDQAIQEIGLFGNQNTVCKPTAPKWRNTVEQLKKKFPEFDA